MRPVAADPDYPEPVTDSPVLEVFWRPGCVFCLMLKTALAAKGISAEWRNIWEDEEAREIVRAANGGNETVPTVRYDGRTLTNPSGKQVAELISVAG